MGSSKAATPQQPDYIGIEKQRIANIPEEARQNYAVASGPDSGGSWQGYANLMESIRKATYPEEQAVREQLTSNVMGSLENPQGITPQQQQALNESRDVARGQMTESIRNRQNLGGTLYGGRSAVQENRMMSELERAFSESDISRDAQNRQAAIANAGQLLQMLYPGVGQTSFGGGGAGGAGGGGYDTNSIFNALMGGYNNQLGINNQNANTRATNQTTAGVGAGAASATIGAALIAW